ncbi:LacI family DNA-binding transcriptional regulator [Streptomyces acidicola]|uniref:LacI family DNA-binding transcriptional regulator n=1 Tax=Streptomyces acidicola TaxID=2596892 RepID=UPI0037BDE4DC
MAASKSRKVTIRDVADEAGVSAAAVSKVLNDGYGVSPEMREKVTTAAQLLGYRPLLAARMMRGRSYTVGVMLADVASPFAPTIVGGIQEDLEGTQLQILLGPGGASPERQQRSIEAMVDRQMDGLILIAPNVPQQFLEDLAQSVPTVVIARHGRGRNYDSVVDDDTAGAALMVEHLVSLGHRRITHISHPIGKLRRPSVLSHTAREDGYTQAMHNHGLNPDVVVGSYTDQGGFDAAMTALQRPERPTAIFAGADAAALGVLRAADELGLRMPQDLTVTGYDNAPVAAVPQISLTTVDHAGKLVGSTSSRLLRERLDGREKAVMFSITPELIVRKSSAPPATPVAPAPLA